MSLNLNLTDNWPALKHFLLSVSCLPSSISHSSFPPSLSSCGSKVLPIQSSVLSLIYSHNPGNLAYLSELLSGL